MSGLQDDSEKQSFGAPDGALPWEQHAAAAAVEPGTGGFASTSARGVALVVAGVYLLAGGLWILLSDRMIAAISPHDDAAFVTKLQTFKGWFFVAATGALLYALVHWGGRRLRAGRRAVERSEALFRGVVESNAVAISVYHYDGRILRANDSFLELVGYTRADLASGLLNWRDMTPPEFHGRENAACKQAVERRGRSDAYEKQYIRKDGRRVPVLITLAPLLGDPRVGVAAVVDVTERKRAEERAAELNRALSEAGRLKDEFLAMLSHELRTPITAIRLWAELLAADRGKDVALLGEALNNITQGVDAQTRLINELLDLSRITSGKLHIEHAEVDLRQVVRAAADAVRPAAKEHGISLEMADGEPLQVTGDADRLRQVVWNLLDNAIKFTPAGGRITLSLDREEGPSGTTGSAALSVSDTGDGIRPEFLAHMFEPFRQADSTTTRRHGGLGIGLSIARRLVELHHGTIRGRSDGPGKGSTFTVLLPAAPLPTSPVEPRAGLRAELKPQPRLPDANNADGGADGYPEPEPVTDGPLTGVRVLVVDDHPDTCRAVARLLGSLGAAVGIAPSTLAALAAARAAWPRVLVSDIGMPGQDGYDLIRTLRRDEADDGRPHLHAIALTAFAMPEDQEKAIVAGFDDYLSKPVNFAELLEAVKRGAAGATVGSC